MPKRTTLDQQWEQLMALCQSEAKFAQEGGHDRLLRLLASDIEELARQMGFSAPRIARRDFCAQRDGDHIVGILRQ